MSLCCRGMTSANLVTAGLGGLNVTVVVQNVDKDGPLFGVISTRTTTIKRGESILFADLVRDDEELITIVLSAIETEII